MLPTLVQREWLDFFGANEFKLSKGERDGVNAEFCQAWDAAPRVPWVEYLGTSSCTAQEEVEGYLTELMPDFVRQWVEDGKLSLGYGQLAAELEPLEMDWNLFWRTVIKGWTAGVKDYDLDLCIQQGDKKTTFEKTVRAVGVVEGGADYDERFADIARHALSLRTAYIEAQLEADLARVQNTCTKGPDQ